MINLLGHLLGLDNVSGPFYAYWSGVGLSIFLPLVYYYKHNCHVSGCLRLGIHPIGHYVVCAKHHPGVPQKITHLHIVKAYKESK